LGWVYCYEPLYAKKICEVGRVPEFNVQGMDDRVKSFTFLRALYSSKEIRKASPSYEDNRVSVNERAVGKGSSKPLSAGEAHQWTFVIRNIGQSKIIVVKPVAHPTGDEFVAESKPVIHIHPQKAVEIVVTFRPKPDTALGSRRFMLGFDVEEEGSERKTSPYICKRFDIKDPSLTRDQQFLPGVFRSRFPSVPCFFDASHSRLLSQHSLGRKNLDDGVTREIIRGEKLFRASSSHKHTPQEVEWKNQLKEYPIPEEIEKSVMATEYFSRFNPWQTREQYKDRSHALLWMEESLHKKRIRNYDLPSVTLEPREGISSPRLKGFVKGTFYRIPVQELAEQRPSVLEGIFPFTFNFIVFDNFFFYNFFFF